LNGRFHHLAAQSLRVRDPVAYTVAQALKCQLLRVAPEPMATGFPYGLSGRGSRRDFKADDSQTAFVLAFLAPPQRAALGEAHMRLALVGLVTVATALTVGVLPGGAQESFFNERYCTRGGFRSGELNCAYHTWQQCRESVPGTGRYCTENPFWHGPREKPATQGRSARRHRPPASCEP
jgi:hypothetical protein